MKSNIPPARSISLLLLLLLACPSNAQFEPALPGYHFSFPRDYFDHPGYQTEWWYYTGNLRSADGERFGFELTFFRQGIRRDAAQTSAWNLRDLYLAHFAISDLDGQKFTYTERTNRGGPGIAGASASAKKVWNGNWSVAWNSEHELLTAVADNMALKLDLKSLKPPVVHGHDGVSQKSAGSGHASHYFSQTRLSASGSITLQGRNWTVTGLAWMDHEFFTRQLDTDQVGWDWFSLQLEDNTELMLFRIRRKDGSVDPFSSGTFVAPDGHATHLTGQDFDLEPQDQTWLSPKTNARYSIRWNVRVPALQLNLSASTQLPSQELVSTAGFTPSYWEGAIVLDGSKGSARIQGVGYLEMTGYARPLEAARVPVQLPAAESSLNDSSPLDQADQKNRDRQQQQDVDVTTECVGRNQSQQPQHQQNYKNSPEQGPLLFCPRVKFAARRNAGGLPASSRSNAFLNNCANYDRPAPRARSR